MSNSIDEEKSRKLNNLLKILRDIDLDFNWLMAVTTLCAQEVAVKKKLDELGESYEGEDFQKIAERLIDTMKKRELEESEILLSISRAYRHIRAKVIHAPHKTRLNQEEADAIFYNTEALVRTLFKKDISQPDIHKFIESIDNLDGALKKFSGFSIEAKKQIFEEILNRISLMSWDELKANEALFEFLKVALKTEPSNSVKVELFDILLRRTLVSGSFFDRERLLRIIAEFTRLSSIRNFIKEKVYINQFLVEFEMSDSFAVAAANAEIVLNLSPLLDGEQINRIVEASLSNDQILFSYGARSSLKRFLAMHKDRINKDKLEELLQVLEK